MCELAPRGTQGANGNTLSMRMLNWISCLANCAALHFVDLDFGMIRTDIKLTQVRVNSQSHREVYVTQPMPYGTHKQATTSIAHPTKARCVMEGRVATITHVIPQTPHCNVLGTDAQKGGECPPPPQMMHEAACCVPRIGTLTWKSARQNTLCATTLSWSNSTLNSVSFPSGQPSEQSACSLTQCVK